MLCAVADFINIMTKPETSRSILDISSLHEKSKIRSEIIAMCFWVL